MSLYDLVITHDWEYDRDFVHLVEEAAGTRGLAPLLVAPSEVQAVLADFRSGTADFRLLFDRASGASPEFTELQALAVERGRDVLDPLDRIRWASDKATMHLELLSAGLPTPHTVILPSFAAQPEVRVSPSELAPLGVPFVIKPANTTGGSLGVIADASTAADVTAARRTYPADKYLLQEKVHPEVVGGRRFWFRGFYVLGEVHLAWWDDRTHVYGELPFAEAAGLGLVPLY
ncbi:MAG TPA: hypothetical protein VLN41_02360, partial [Candidatus Bathyarchaeia archaeon]|nr:hypothetical protein [Candidatus Bathyarchaeia archaeon]